MSQNPAMLTAAICLGLLLQQAPAAVPDEPGYLKRMRWPEILGALQVRPGDSIADLGSGDGDYTLPLARTVGGSGRVFAVDIDDAVLQRLQTRLEKEGIKGVTVVRGGEEDPGLAPGSLDAVLVLNALHWIKKPPEVLRHVFDALKPGGRIVVVDAVPVRTRNRPRSDQFKNHVLAPEHGESDLKQAGFTVIERRDGFIDNPDEERAWWLIRGERPRGPAR